MSEFKSYVYKKIAELEQVDNSQLLIEIQKKLGEIDARLTIIELKIIEPEGKALIELRDKIEKEVSVFNSIISFLTFSAKSEFEFLKAKLEEIDKKLTKDCMDKLRKEK